MKTRVHAVAAALLSAGCAGPPEPVWEAWGELWLRSGRLGAWHARVDPSGRIVDEAEYRMQVRGTEVRTEVVTTLRLRDGTLIAASRTRDGEPVEPPEAPPLEWVAHLDEATVEDVGPVSFEDAGREGPWTWRRWHPDGAVLIDEDGRPRGARYGPLELRPAEGPVAWTELADPFALLGHPVEPLDAPRKARVVELSVRGVQVPSGQWQRVEEDRVRIEAPLEAEIGRVPLGEGAGALVGSLPRSYDDRKQATWGLVRHVAATLDDAPTPGPPAALAALEDGQGDCNEHAALLVELARAAGLPARPVSGLVYLPEPPGFYPHAWAEVDLGGSAGWVAVDPALDQPIADATHLKLVEGEASAWEALQKLGQLELEVLSAR